MSTADPGFRANPNRAIYIQGSIDEAMVSRLTPKIIELQASSRDPVTVYIDSRGGSVHACKIIQRLLRGTNQDGELPCRIITVVVNTAASAAADLLSSGDYAIAYPSATIFYHGVRQSPSNPITVEFGSALTEGLKIANSQSAMALARATDARFMFRFVTLKSDFEGIRDGLSRPEMTDLECFVSLLSDRLSPRAKELLDRARERDNRYSALLDEFLAAIINTANLDTKGRGEVDALVLKKLIEREASNHKDNERWSFIDGGLARVNDDFFLLNEYILCLQGEQFTKLCERWGPWAITAEEEAEIIAKEQNESARSIARVEKARVHFRPVWSFFVALCHALQQGEDNHLAATDAYWLGLIDEVIGVPLQSLRLIVEFENNAGTSAPS